MQAPRLALLALCLAALHSAQAGPVTATLDGQVTELREGGGSVMAADFPVGTAVSMALNFDASLPGVVPGRAPIPLAASGSLVFGSTAYNITGIHVWATSFLVAGLPVWWVFNIDAEGPDVGGGTYYTTQMVLNSTLDALWVSPSTPSMQAAWAVPLNGGGSMIHAMTIEGSYAIGPDGNAVPLPSTAALALLGLAVLGGTRRRG